VPVIAAIEGRAHVHSEYALIANVIVAAEGATFHDVPHFAGGIVPGDGIFTTWSYRAGAGRAEAFLLNPQLLTAGTAYEWGVVAEIVPNGKALSRAQELAKLYLKAPEVTRRNTRIHFIQPLKERIVREVGYCGDCTVYRKRHGDFYLDRRGQQHLLLFRGFPMRRAFWTRLR
jgi:enoyl-CoA hydratase/carnithine racemase